VCASSTSLLSFIFERTAVSAIAWGKICLITALCAGFTCGCAHRPATGPRDAFREVSGPSLMDDLNFAGLREALESQSKVLKSSPTTRMEVGPVSVSRADYANALEKLSQVLAGSAPAESKSAYIEKHFRFFEFAGGDEPGEILLTSYFEPVLRGSLTPTRALSQPLYAKPQDLLSVQLSTFAERFKGEKALKARLDGSKVVPYFSREDIDGKGALRGKQLELAWVDPIDAFFLHIQGSGTLVLPNGEEHHLVYADKNGHRYEAVGKFLKSRIAPHKVTMQRVEATLRGMTAQERDAVLFLNPSYVFFQRSKQRAITSLGVPATPGRTIAADPRFAPKGALAFLQFQKPIFEAGQSPGDDPVSFAETSRFVVDQDSGGAITGTGRIDLFWGRGDKAKRYAGVIQNRARILYLVPR
jgi:membrane-bound lytic murein transglycosylase A